MKNITYAVSGINSVDNPGAGIGIIRSIQAETKAFTCIGLAYDAMDPGLYLEQFVDRGYLLPYPSSSCEKYLERLLYICEENDVNIIIPAFDSELPHYIKNKELLKKKNILMNIPSKKQYKDCNKSNLALLGEKIGIPVPATYSVTSLEELNSAMENTGFPCMIKGCFYEAYKAHSFHEGHSYFHKLSCKWGFPVLVQQYVTGNDYNLVGLGGENGEFLGAVAAKKLLLTQQGKIWTAVTINNPEMVDICHRFLEETKFSGGFELEFRLSDTEQLYLLEINPRFPAWVFLASAAGVNLPYRYVQNLLEGRIDFDNDYAVGRMLIRYTGEMIKEITDFENIVVKGATV